MRATSRSDVAPSRESSASVAPWHQLGDEVDVVLVAAQLVQGDDPRVVEPGGRERLALDARPVGVVALARDHLHGHVALELAVARPPDHAEAAGAEPLLQPVAAQREASPALSRTVCVFAMTGA